MISEGKITLSKEFVSVLIDVCETDDDIECQNCSYEKYCKDIKEDIE